MTYVSPQFENINDINTCQTTATKIRGAKQSIHNTWSSIELQIKHYHEKVINMEVGGR